MNDIQSLLFPEFCAIQITLQDTFLWRGVGTTVRLLAAVVSKSYTQVTFPGASEIPMCQLQMLCIAHLAVDCQLTSRCD